MTDRELLELAAKAAGIDAVYEKAYLTFFNRDGRGRSIWNPLDDDGDALRLAVKLALVVYCDDVEAWCEWGELNENLEYEHHVSAEPEYQWAESVRRAIVLAAAAIAKTGGAK